MAIRMTPDGAQSVPDNKFTPSTRNNSPPSQSGAAVQNKSVLDQVPEINKSAVKFNPDKSVTITRAGVTSTLTPEQYKDYIKVQKGEGTSYDPNITNVTKGGVVGALGSQLKEEQLQGLSPIDRLAAGESFEAVFPNATKEEVLANAAPEQRSVLNQLLFGLDLGVDTETGQPREMIQGTAPLISNVPLPALAGISKLKSAVTGIGGLLVGGGISGAIGALTGGKVRELEGDIETTRTATREIVSDVSKGGDVLQAIDELKSTETEMIKTLGQLHLALQTDVKARYLSEKDIEEFARRNLETIIRRRQALERYYLTGQTSELDLAAGLEFEE